MIGCHARYQPARQEQLGVRCLAQGHFDTPRVGSNRQPSNCQTTALLPEPYRPGIRGRVHSATGLSPYEVIAERPMKIRCPPGLMLDKDLADAQMVSYCVQLTNALRSVYQQVKAALPVPASGPLHDLQPGYWVVIKDFQRKKWHQPRWRGPYQVLLITPTAVRVEGHTAWVHASHCKRAPPAATEG